VCVVPKSMPTLIAPEFMRCRAFGVWLLPACRAPTGWPWRWHRSSGWDNSTRDCDKLWCGAPPPGGHWLRKPLAAEARADHRADEPVLLDSKTTRI